MASFLYQFIAAMLALTMHPRLAYVTTTPATPTAVHAPCPLGQQLVTPLRPYTRSAWHAW